MATRRMQSVYFLSVGPLKLGGPDGTRTSVDPPRQLLQQLLLRISAGPLRQHKNP